MKEKNKLTEDEKSEITKLNNQYQTIIFSMGEFSLKRDQLKKEISFVDSKLEDSVKEFEELKRKESDFLDRLSEKYGVGTLDTDNATYLSQ